jgi:hypothetical protein
MRAVNLQVSFCQLKLRRLIALRAVVTNAQTVQISGGKKQSEERASLFDVRVNLLCWTKPLRGSHVEGSSYCNL